MPVVNISVSEEWKVQVQLRTKRISDFWAEIFKCALRLVLKSAKTSLEDFTLLASTPCLGSCTLFNSTGIDLNRAIAIALRDTCKGLVGLSPGGSHSPRGLRRYLGRDVFLM